VVLVFNDSMMRLNFRQPAQWLVCICNRRSVEVQVSN
jgi:hypothetical protein